MKQATKDGLLATALAVAITGLITWRDVASARERARGAYR
jgi:hypothetical protein